MVQWIELPCSIEQKDWVIFTIHIGRCPVLLCEAGSFKMEIRAFTLFVNLTFQINHVQKAATFLCLVWECVLNLSDQAQNYHHCRLLVKLILRLSLQ